MTPPVASTTKQGKGKGTLRSPAGDGSWLDQPLGPIACVLLVIAVGAALRWASIGRLSFSGDEAWTLRWSAQSVPWLMSHYLIGLTMHGYILLVKALQELFGSSELVLKLPSLVAATLLLPALFAATRRWLDPPVAVLATLLAAFDPRLILFSRSARVYAILVLWALGSMWLASVAESRSKSWPYVVLGGLNGLGIALSLGATSLVAAQVVWLVTEAALAGGTPRRLALARGVAISSIVAGSLSLAFYWPTLPALVEFAQEYSSSTRPRIETLSAALAWLHEGRGWTLASGLIGAGVLLRKGPYGRMIVTWALVPLLMALASNPRFPGSAVGRSLFAIVPAHLILMATGWFHVAGWIRPRGRALLAGALALCSIAWAWGHSPLVNGGNFLRSSAPHPLAVERINEIGLSRAVVLTTRSFDRWFYVDRVPGLVRSVAQQIKKPVPLGARPLLVVSPRSKAAHEIWREAFWIHPIEGEGWQGRYVVLESNLRGAKAGDRAFRTLLRGLVATEEEASGGVASRRHRRLAEMFGALASLERELGSAELARRYARDSKRHRELAATAAADAV